MSSKAMSKKRLRESSSEQSEDTEMLDSPIVQTTKPKSSKEASKKTRDFSPYENTDTEMPDSNQKPDPNLTYNSSKDNAWLLTRQTQDENKARKDFENSSKSAKDHEQLYKTLNDLDERLKSFNALEEIPKSKLDDILRGTSTYRQRFAEREPFLQ